MAEILSAYDQVGRKLKEAARQPLLAEMRTSSIEHGDAPFAVPCVNLMLVNAKGELYVVQRADKPENPFLFDKTVGGHVTAGEGFDETLIRETYEEIGVELEIMPVLNYPQAVLQTDLRKKAIAKLIDFQLWYASKREEKTGRSWWKRAQLAMYVGRYDGPVEFRDGEALQVKMLNRNAMLTQLKQKAKHYTYDLHFWVNNYNAFFWSQELTFK